MKPIERRLRALESVVNVEHRPPPRRVIVEHGEDVDDVLRREGIVLSGGPHLELIVRQILPPGADMSEAGEGFRERVRG